MARVPAARDQHAPRRLRPRRRPRRRGDDHARPVPVNVVTLYHAQGCSLCERARAQLVELRDELGFELNEVAIDGDPELEARYREWLPVVELDGERLFVYYVQPETLRRRLHKV